jgi:hypothetical protein
MTSKLLETRDVEPDKLAEHDEKMNCWRKERRWETHVIVRYSRNWSVSNLEGAEPQIWENLYT